MLGLAKNAGQVGLAIKPKEDRKRNKERFLLKAKMAFNLYTFGRIFITLSSPSPSD